MKILVCGGRYYKDRSRVFQLLDYLNSKKQVSMLIQGGATGADLEAAGWANSRAVHLVTVHANWKAHGKAAGPKRNAAMLMLKPDLIVAFPGGRGTANMIYLAKQLDVPIIGTEEDINGLA